MYHNWSPNCTMLLKVVNSDKSGFRGLVFEVPLNQPCMTKETFLTSELVHLKENYFELLRVVKCKCSWGWSPLKVTWLYMYVSMYLICACRILKTQSPRPLMYLKYDLRQTLQRFKMYRTCGQVSPVALNTDWPWEKCSLISIAIGNWWVFLRLWDLWSWHLHELSIKTV